MVDIPTFFTRIIQRIEALGVSTDLTLYRLSLGSQNSVTGWYKKTYDATTINMVVIPSSAQHLLFGTGTYSRKDAIAFSKTRLYEGDVIKDFYGYHYTMVNMRLHQFGSKRVFYEYDLQYLPYFLTTEVVAPPLGPWGFEIPEFEELLFENGVRT